MAKRYELCVMLKIDGRRELELARGTSFLADCWDFVSDSWICCASAASFAKRSERSRAVLARRASFSSSYSRTARPPPEGISDLVAAAIDCCCMSVNVWATGISRVTPIGFRGFSTLSGCLLNGDLSPSFLRENQAPIVLISLRCRFLTFASAGAGRQVCISLAALGLGCARIRRSRVLRQPIIFWSGSRIGFLMLADHCASPTLT